MQRVITSFKDRYNRLVEVEFTNTKLNGVTITVDTESGSPSIQNDYTDHFEPLIASNFNINLLTDKYLGDILFAANCTDVKATVKRDSEVIWKGYVQPSMFTQPYVGLDSLTVTCTDLIGLLQYRKLSDFSSWKQEKSNQRQLSFKDWLNLFIPLDENKVWYDGSRTTESGESVWNSLSCINANFLGEDETEESTAQDIMREILQFLGAHITYHNGEYFISSWDSHRGDSITWTRIGHEEETFTQDITTIPSSADLYSDASTNISMD